MTLAQELIRTAPIAKRPDGAGVEPRQALHLPFNGRLSPDEQRMAEQGAFDGPASWEP